MAIAWSSGANGNDSSAGTSHSVTKPTVNTGDLLVLFATSGFDGADFGAVTSSDWSHNKFTSPSNSNTSTMVIDGDPATVMLHRIIDGTEGSTLSFTTANSVQMAWVVHRFTSTVGFSKWPIRGANPRWQAAQANVPLPGCYNEQHTGMTCIAVMSEQSGDHWLFPSGYTERWDAATSALSCRHSLQTSDSDNNGLDYDSSVPDFDWSFNGGSASSWTIPFLLREKWEPGGTAIIRPVGQPSFVSQYSYMTPYDRGASTWTEGTAWATDAAANKAQQAECLMSPVGTSEASGDRAIGLKSGANNGAAVSITMMADYPPDDMAEAADAVTAATVRWNSVQFGTYGDDEAFFYSELRVNRGSNWTTDHVSVLPSVLESFIGSVWTGSLSGTAPAYNKTYNATSDITDPASWAILSDGWAIQLSFDDLRVMGGDGAAIIVSDVQWEITYTTAGSPSLATPRRSMKGLLAR